MDNSNNKPTSSTTKEEREAEEKRDQERKIDEQLEQTFPASDPPSYSQPHDNEEEG